MPDNDPKPPLQGGPDQKPTTNAEEWGDRVNEGRRIARGGQDDGPVPGATGDDDDDPRSGGDQDAAKK